MKIEIEHNHSIGCIHKKFPDYFNNSLDYSNAQRAIYIIDSLNR